MVQGYCSNLTSKGGWQEGENACSHGRLPWQWLEGGGCGRRSRGRLLGVEEVSGVGAGGGVCSFLPIVIPDLGHVAASP